MVSIYLIDESGIYVGSRTIDPMCALPRCTLTPPPVTTGDEVAQWLDGEWRVLSERPSSYPSPAEPIPAPRSISRAQGKAALIGAGMWQQVLDFVSTIQDQKERNLAEVALHDTTEWNRDSPFLNTAAVAIGLTPEQMDALFVTAASINL